MSAPTEEEIRAELARGWSHVPPNRVPAEAEWDNAFLAASMVLNGLYDLEDMRKSEIEAMDALSGAVVDPIRDRVRAEINEALVSAMVRFAAERPHIPRARRAVPA
jgi:hypothetical protein